MGLAEQYNNETGEKALYRRNGADYHTLKYVRWLENKIEIEKCEYFEPPNRCSYLEDVVQ